MRWPWRRRRAGRPSEDARALAEHMRRAMTDTDHLVEHIDTVASRAHRAEDASEAILARNHFREAIEDSMSRRVRHP